VSGTAHDQIRNKVKVGFDDLGIQQHSHIAVDSVLVGMLLDEGDDGDRHGPSSTPTYRPYRAYRPGLADIGRYAVGPSGHDPQAVRAIVGTNGELATMWGSVSEIVRLTR
jgi:hypothetical protein